MEENLKQEVLLRHLLSREKCSNDNFVYSFLLGSRLFLSPHQLLTELHRLAIENTPPNAQWNGAGKFCSNCRQLQTKSADVSNTNSTRTGTDFRSKQIISSYRSECIVTEGDETIRRRRRGRRRNLTEGDSTRGELPSQNELRLSRDSGILSAVLEPLDLDKSNNNTANASEMSSRLIANNNDSGYIVDNEIESCNGCSKTTHRETCMRSKKQLLFILREWVRHFPADFRNKKIMWTLNDVIKSCQTDNEDLNGLCTEIVDCISRRTATQESYEQQLNDLDEQELKRPRKFRKTKDWMLSYVLKMKDTTHVNDFAQQLCLIEMDLLRHVGAEEFLQLFTADGAEDVRTNLGACVRWFNRLSRLVATLICMCRKRKHARQVVTFFVRVANRSFELSNFNSSMAILTGLSFGPVTRLRKTWTKLVITELGELQNVFDPSNNFLKYRSVYMRRAEQLHSPMVEPKTEKGANRHSVISRHSIGSVNSSHQGDSGVECDHETPSPGTHTGFNASMKHFAFSPTASAQDGVMVPFLVLLVKDVYFLNHAIQTVNSEGNINFEKLRNLSNILKPLEEWKQMLSPYQKLEELQEFLLRAPVQSDGELYLLSYKREAPTSRFEKQQLKSLRLDRELKKKNGTLPPNKERCKTV